MCCTAAIEYVNSTDARNAPKGRRVSVLRMVAVADARSRDAIKERATNFIVRRMVVVSGVGRMLATNLLWEDRLFALRTEEANDAMSKAATSPPSLPLDSVSNTGAAKSVLMKGVKRWRGDAQTFVRRTGEESVVSWMDAIALQLASCSFVARMAVVRG